MQDRSKLFSWVVYAGIAVNMVFVVLALFAPDSLTNFAGLERAVPAIWLRFSGWLLMLLSIFYVPAALDPVRYQTIAWLAVFARFAGVVFFLGLIFFFDLPRAYLPFGLVDLVFGVVEGFLLQRLSKP